MRPNRMLADTAAIHRFGAAQNTHAADVDEIAARLAQVGTALTPDGLGSVGARFLAALCAAVDRDLRAANALGGRVAACAVTARDTAVAYAGAERAAGAQVTTIGV